MVVGGVDPLATEKLGVLAEPFFVIFGSVGLELLLDTLYLVQVLCKLFRGRVRGRG